MSRFLIDTNVILDVLTQDPAWAGWSADTLEACAERGPVAVNPIIWAELSAGFDRVEDLEAALPPEDWERLPLPWAAAFVAGRAFRGYRDRGGARTAPLPDFYIGAHAAVAGLTVVTRDDRRFRTYFPKLSVIAPQSRPG